MYSDKKKKKSNKKNTKALARKAGAAVLKTRQDIKRLDSEPKGHFNKRIIGSPSDTRSNLQNRLYRQTKKRDSLRGVVRKFKK